LSAEVYVINADGSGLNRLTDNRQEERSPDWSPDGERVAFSCHSDGADLDHEICVMNADGTGLTRLTDNTLTELSPSWSPDADKIAFQRPGPDGGFEIWVMNPDGTDQTRLTSTPGPPTSLFPNWGKLRVHD
jgi:TolB protein